jgi:DNA invertase Pin-like site-specific DNA recombinase
MKLAIYARVSTNAQTNDNQVAELEAWAERAGHSITNIYEDIASGTKGRDGRPQFDALLKAAVQRQFDMLAVWSVDRIARSLVHLMQTLETIRASGVGLYIHTQSLDTSTPAGRALFGMIGVFSEFELAIRRDRQLAGIKRAQSQGVRFGKAPMAPERAEELKREIITLRKTGLGSHKIAQQLACGHGRVCSELRAAGLLEAQA